MGAYTVIYQIEKGRKKEYVEWEKKLSETPLEAKDGKGYYRLLQDRDMDTARKFSREDVASISRGGEVIDALRGRGDVEINYTRYSDVSVDALAELAEGIILSTFGDPDGVYFISGGEDRTLSFIANFMENSDPEHYDYIAVTSF